MMCKHWELAACTEGVCRPNTPASRINAVKRFLSTQNWDGSHHFVFEVLQFISVEREPPLLPALQNNPNTKHPQLEPQELICVLTWRLHFYCSHLHKRSLFHQVAFLCAELQRYVCVRGNFKQSWFLRMDVVRWLKSGEKHCFFWFCFLKPNQSSVTHRWGLWVVVETTAGAPTTSQMHKSKKQADEKQSTFYLLN